MDQIQALEEKLREADRELEKREMQVVEVSEARKADMLTEPASNTHPILLPYTSSPCSHISAEPFLSGQPAVEPGHDGPGS